MANKLLVIGASGSGKSRSMKSLDPTSTFIINVIGKDLPFQGWKKNYPEFDIAKGTGNVYKCKKAESIVRCLSFINTNMKHIKTVVIDDAQYIMSYEYMDKSEEKGYEKWTVLAKNMFNVLTAADSLRDDLTVVFLSHSIDDEVNGYKMTKMKTIGKSLDDKITIEGLFTVVLLAVSYKGDDKKMGYGFVTQSNGTTTAKSPEGMFDNILIENDLQFVLDQINKYNKG